MSSLPLVLVVDDEPRSQEALRRTLEEDFDVLTAADAGQAHAVLAREMVQVILCDQRMPGQSGVQFLRQVREEWPDVVRIIISGYTDAEDIIAGINEAGIYQFILKPWQPEALLLGVKNAARLYDLQLQTQELNVELKTAAPVLARRINGRRALARSLGDLSQIRRGPGSPMQQLCDMVERVACYDLPILVTGESGTGKELVARGIHYRSPRAERAFVVENCAAVPDQLLESELFGHKRGAFTGAYEDRIGLFQQADGGTIFLDEVGETSPAFQSKLLRVLQDGEIRPVGSSRSLQVDVRVISATNRDLDRDIRSGRFREDLYYRLSTVAVHVPPLRERVMDVAPIAEAALEKAMRTLGKQVAGFTEEALECMKAYRWPGNVRELQNEVTRMLALATEPRLGAELLSPRVVRAAAQEEERDVEQLLGVDGSLRERMEALEARVLKETLIRHRWNKTRAASELGLSRVGLRAKLARYGLERKL
ncbi:MAG: sigma-54-dependent transcriptional regulator [Pseudomonadota bacterium]